MNKQLPTRDECLALTKSTDAFYVSETVIEDYKVEMYDYRLAGFEDFYPNGLDKAGWEELRGLTFIEQENGSWKRFIALSKFFNVNQTIGSMYEDVIKETIIKVQDKLDGSMITFIKFPNGVIKAKSKMSFISPQAVMAQEIFDNSRNIKDLVCSALESNSTCVFELVSPKNQIVLDYQNTRLVLLQYRTDDGKYHNSKDIAEAYKVQHAKEFDLTLDDMMDLREREEKIEGWVVTTTNGLYKIKTSWYMQMHGLVTEGTRENLLIETILDDNIDDVIGQLEEGEKKEFIVLTTSKVQKKVNHIIKEYKKLAILYSTEKHDKKSFAKKYRSHQCFHMVIKVIDLIDINTIDTIADYRVKEYVLFATRKLNMAQEWLKEE